MEAHIALPAALIGDPTRAAMLMALMDGRPQPASALACAANVTPQAASNHLARLLDGGMVAVQTQGRHRYYRLASPAIAAVLEALAGLAPCPRDLDRPITAKGRALRHARSCYDHLAGRLGVALTDALLQRGLLHPPADGARDYRVTQAGRIWFAALGIEVDPPAGPNTDVKPLQGRCCLDWTERRFHLAGSLGTALLARLEALDWLQRDRASRAVRVTPIGEAALRDLLGLDAIDLGQDRNRPAADVAGGSALPGT
jgi:DNA-binding transcriptional ArsR family regulator